MDDKYLKNYKEFFNPFRKNSEVLKILIVFGILIVNTGFVFAAAELGVGSPYYKNNPLKIYPGQEREIVFDIYNCPSRAETCDKQNIIAEVSLVEGKEIASLVSGSKYNLDFGDTGKIRLKISIPNNAAIGDSYNVKMLLQSVPEGSGVQVGVGYNIEFPVLVKEASEVPADYVPIAGETQETTGMFLVIVIILSIVILIAIISIYIMLKKRRRV